MCARAGVWGAMCGRCQAILQPGDDDDGAAGDWGALTGHAHEEVGTQRGRVQVGFHCGCHQDQVHFGLAAPRWCRGAGVPGADWDAFVKNAELG